MSEVDLMRHAIELAGRANPHPNPRVGAVVVDSFGYLAGTGFHKAPGEPHAERVALEEAGDRARGGTLVVTLEPCPHTGLTPPCTTAVDEAGVARVVVGALDPDARVAGRGLETLRQSGIDVAEGVLSSEVEAADPAYFHHRRTGRPRYTLKWAMTLDGQVAAADGTSQWITSQQARRDAHRLRAEMDAVVVGAGTLRSDDPQLDVRLDGYSGRQPRPVIIGGTTPLPVERRIWDRQPLVLVGDPTLAPAGEVVTVDTYDAGAVSDVLAEHGLLEVLIEGGPTLIGSFAQAAARFVIYIGGRVAGGVGSPPIGGAFTTIVDAVPVSISAVASLGPDLRVDAEVA